MQALYAQLLVGLINGSFYALLSLGLAVIFGMLNIINFAHGALYMMGAFCAYFLLNVVGIGYWPALIIAPIAVGIFGMILERTMLQWLSGLDHLYGLLLTFGMALIIQGIFQNYFGSSGLPYAIPDELKGGMNLGFMFLPIYRGWVVVFSLIVCIATWYLIERTRLGANLRAATENPTLVRAFGINVPRMITLTYGLGVGLAALAGVLSAPINQVRPLMGADLIIVVFAVVVIGGMGSIMGSIITGFALGVIEGLTKYFYPEASNTVVFVLMVLVLLVKPSGLTGRATDMTVLTDDTLPTAAAQHPRRDDRVRHHGGAAGGRAADRHLSVLRDAGAVLCAAGLRLQPADRLWRPAVVRPRDVPGHRRLLHRACAEGLGLYRPSLEFWSAPPAPPGLASSPASSRFAGRASTSR